MQPFKSPFSERFTNATPPESESLFRFSFIIAAEGSQPIWVDPVYARGKAQALIWLPERNIESELARYVEKMAGTEYDLDKALEAASIEHILSSDSDDE